MNLRGDPITLTGTGGYEERERDNPDMLCIHDRVAIASVKRGNLTVAGNNLVEQYRNKDVLVLNTVQQVAGYQNKYLAEYGFITRLAADGVF